MHFQVEKHEQLADDGDPIRRWFTWTLEKKEGRVCQSAHDFDTEQQARSDIASVKKSMKGAGRCKVLSPGEEPS